MIGEQMHTPIRQPAPMGACSVLRLGVCSPPQLSSCYFFWAAYGRLRLLYGNGNGNGDTSPSSSLSVALALCRRRYALVVVWVYKVGCCQLLRDREWVPLSVWNSQLSTFCDRSLSLFWLQARSGWLWV